MKSIIEGFYYGEVLPCERPSPKTKKYNDTAEQLSQIESDILNKHPDCKPKLEDYRDTMHILSSLEGLNDFTQGFRLGAKFMIDIFTADDKNIKKTK